MSDIKLPAVIDITTPALTARTDALGVPRDILASDKEIGAAWANLLRIMKKVSPELRTEELALICVAVVAGLFDSAIGYV